MEVLWLISQGETQARAGQLGGVSKATVERYVAIYRSQGVAGLPKYPTPVYHHS
jgi:transposase